MSDTTGGRYDSGLDSIFVLEGDWVGGVVYNFQLCKGCGQWEAWADNGDVCWLIYFRDRCWCPASDTLFDALWESNRQR